jgi:protein SCO1/2
LAQRLFFHSLFAMVLVTYLVDASLASTKGSVESADQPAVATGAPIPNFDGFGIEEKLGTSVPLNLVFRGENGNPVTLSSLIDGKKTTLLTLNYSDCPGLCVAQLDGLTESLRKFDALKLGEDFQVITISIDPKESSTRALATKTKYVGGLGLNENFQGWRFLTGDQDAITVIADSVGFRYTWDPVSKRFNHSAATIVLSPKGMVTRYLYSPSIEPNTMNMALIEGSQGKLGSSLDAIALWCMAYDPASNRYTAVGYKMLSLGAAAFVLMLLGLTAPFWFAGRRPQETLVETQASTEL